MKQINTIKGFEHLKDNYYITTDGKVISSYKGMKEMKASINRDGYEQLSLVSKDGKKNTIKVHRLVALAFIDNPEEKPEVNHINEIKTDNNVNNLMWTTPKENSNHGTRNERIGDAFSVEVYQYDLNGNLIMEWSSAAEAGRNGFTASHISACANGKRKTHKGYIWKFKTN